MTHDRAPQNTADPPSAVATEYYSTADIAEQAPDNPTPLPVSDVATGNIGCNCLSSSASCPASDAASNTSGRSPRVPRVILQTDSTGRHYGIDDRGFRFEVVEEDQSSALSHTDDNPGVPAHYTSLFQAPSEQDEPSTETALSESTPQEGPPADYLALGLDINPDELNATQLAQLNAIQGHMLSWLP
ncbi:hypothetical protein B0H13DRAFT_2300377 [Mycena leptocephala]|nr:hypothetical protein B0H13DRAFT_2300377 [Mycena leptocephala]